MSVLVLLPRQLRRGNAGRDVLMVQRALSRAGLRRWGTFTLYYGPGTAKQVKRFQAKHRLTADGVYGPATHRKLACYFDAYGAAVMAELYHDMHDPIERALAANIVAVNYRQLVHYSQGAGRMQIVRQRIRDLLAWFKRGRSLTEDCSSFQTGAAFLAGLSDPNRFGFNGIGYTGSMAVQGRRLARPQKGALGYYGNGWPYRHVVRALDDSLNPKVGSHGSESGPHIEGWDYRSDFSHWRFYD